MPKDRKSQAPLRSALEIPGGATTGRGQTRQSTLEIPGVGTTERAHTRQSTLEIPVVGTTGRPRQSTLRIPESRTTDRADNSHSRREIRFTTANLRRQVGPEDGKDYYSRSVENLVRESEKKSPEHPPSTGFFAFLKKRNPFSFFSSSKATPAAVPAKKKVKKEPTPSTSTASTIESTASSASSRSYSSTASTVSTVSSSRSTISSVSSRSSIKVSFSDLQIMDEKEFREKQRKAYVAAGTPPPPPKIARKTVILQSRQQKQESTKKENTETNSELKEKRLSKKVTNTTHEKTETHSEVKGHERQKKSLKKTQIQSPDTEGPKDHERQKKSLKKAGHTPTEHEGEEKSAKKVIHAPQLPARRTRTKSYVSIQMRSNAKVHPKKSKSPQSPKRSKNLSRSHAVEFSDRTESSVPEQSESHSYLVSETDSNTTASVNPSKTHVKTDDSSVTTNTTKATQSTKSDATFVTVQPAQPENEPEPESVIKTWKKTLGLRNEVIRVRNSVNRQSFKFTPVHEGTAGESAKRSSRASYTAFVDDPLRQDNIRRAANFRGWIKVAHMALPSKIGVPVEDSSDVLHAGLDAVEEVNDEHADPKESYNKVLENMQKHIQKSGYRSHALHKGKDPATYVQRVSTLKLLPDHLANKRDYKKYLIENASEESIPKIDLKYIKAAIKAKIHKHYHLAFNRCHDFALDLIYYCSIWRSSINDIHGRFGATTAMYFDCIRSVLFLNIAYFIIIFLFLIFPEIVIDIDRPRPYNTEPSEGCYPEKGCNSFIPKINKRLPFSPLDFITGEGFMEDSYMYFSGYRDNTAQHFCPLRPVDDLDKRYDHPMNVTAFRFMIMAFLLFAFKSVVISHRIMNYYEVSGMDKKVFGMVGLNVFRKVLCAWDYCCTDPEGAVALHKSIRRQFKELGDEFAKEKEEVLKAAAERRTNIFLTKLGRKWGQLLTHWLINAAVFFVCGCASVGVYFAYYSRIVWIVYQEDNCNAYRAPPAPLLIAPAIIISISSEVMIWFCTWCATLEPWRAPESRNLTIFGRIGLYYIAMVAAIFGYAFKYFQFLKDQSQKAGYASMIYSLCYEEKIGEEIYRVVVIHGLVHGLSSWMWILYYKIRKKINKDFNKRPIFDPTHHAMDVFFVHTICGFGYVYCPLISVIFAVRLLITFYSHRYILYNYCSLPDHLSYVSEVSLPYFVTHLASYLISTFLNIYVFVDMDPSYTCGPFTNFHSKNDSVEVQYYEIFGDVYKSKNTEGAQIVMRAENLWVLILFIIALLHTFRCWAEGYTETLEMMKQMMVYEKMDRDFLLEAIYNVVKQQDDEDSDEDHDDEGDDTSFIPTPENPKRRSSWKDSPLAEGIFEYRSRNMGSLHTDDKRHDHPVYINPHDGLHGRAHHHSKIRRTLLEPSSRKSRGHGHLPDIPEEHNNHDGTRKASVADVWIQAYHDVRRARKMSEEMKELHKLYGSDM